MVNKQASSNFSSWVNFYACKKSSAVEKLALPKIKIYGSKTNVLFYKKLIYESLNTAK